MTVFAILATSALGWKKGVGAEYRIVELMSYYVTIIPSSRMTLTHILQ